MPFRSPHPVRFDAVANFRDLGGHRTRDGRTLRAGRLFRSGHLGHATDEDRARLAELGVCRVFDFRTPRDIEADGADRLPDGATQVSLPMHDPAVANDLRALIESATPEQIEERFGNGKAAEYMTRAAAGLVTERREQYARFIAELASPEGFPALFHCSAGKDRAGWAGSVVLLALGVDEEEVIEQYLLSNRAARELVARFEDQGGNSGWGTDFSGVLSPMLEVRREYIQASFDAVNRTHGSFDAYLADGLGIDEAQREQLRANLLEPA